MSVFVMIEATLASKTLQLRREEDNSDNGDEEDEV